MTTLGKILTVMTVLLTVVVMMMGAAVYTAGRNWRESYVGVNSQLEQARRLATTTQNEHENTVTELKRQLEEATNRANSFQAQTDRLTEENEQKENELVNTRQERDVAIRQSSIANQEAEAKRQETERHRNVIAKQQAELNELSRKNRELTDQLYNRDVQVAEVTEKHARLLKQYATLQEVLSHNEIDPNPEAHKGLTSPPPVVEGLVMDTLTITADNTKLIEVSVGSDDGLAIGHNMYVYRQEKADGTPGQYLGEIKIMRVTPDRAVGRLVLNTKNGIIERGDNVTTKL